MKNKISMSKMSISMTFNRIFPDLQDFQAWNQQVQISKTFQIFKAPYEPRLLHVSKVSSRIKWWVEKQPRNAVALKAQGTV
jgi:hypothetical protein